MSSQIVLALGLVLAGAQAEPCPEGWPAPETVGSLEAVVSNSVEDGLFELLDFRGEGRIYILDFGTRSDQNLMFDAASTFIETATDREMVPAGQGMSDYDGHNLVTASLARYFHSREVAAEALSESERLLRDGLLCMDLLLRIEGRLVGKPRTAVLATNHDVLLRDARAAIVSHELYHGLDMTDEGHWRSTIENWDALRAGEGKVWRKLVLGQRDYDSKDQALVMAEVGAYSGMFGLEKILRLRQARDLGAFESSELEALRRGRSFEGLLGALAFEDAAFLLEMEYGFQAVVVSKESASHGRHPPLVLEHPELRTTAIVFPSQAGYERALGRLEIERLGGDAPTVFEIDTRDVGASSLSRFLPPDAEAELAEPAREVVLRELERGLSSFDRRLPEEEQLRLVAAELLARDAELEAALVADCPVCSRSTRLAWLLYQCELLVGRSREEVATQAIEDWRAMQPTDRESYSQLFTAFGRQPGAEEMALRARSLELAVRRSGVRRRSELSGLPIGVAKLMLVARRVVESRYGPRIRRPEEDPEP